MKVVNKKTLSLSVYDRLSGAVPKRLIYDIINIVADEIFEKLSSGEPVSIDNFGTFSVYLRPEHDALNVHTNVVERLPAKRNIRFITHSSLDGLIRNRIKKFET